MVNIALRPIESPREIEDDVYMTLDELKDFLSSFRLTLLHLEDLVDLLYEWEDTRNL
jgi:hypothetical protein